MGKPELVDAFSFPRVPRVKRVGGRGTIALEHEHVVTVAGEQHRRAKTHHPAADNRELHGIPLVTRVPPSLQVQLRWRQAVVTGCDTPPVAREERRIERVKFTVDDLAPVVVCMAKLASAGDGWINLIPRIADEEERPTSLGFLTLFSGGSSGLTMCTWIPGSHNRRGPTLPSLGISHVTSRRAVARLSSLGLAIPPAWRVEQDHPRRGLVLRVPFEESHEELLAWAIRAVGALTPGPIRGWHADVHLPETT